MRVLIVEPSPDLGRLWSRHLERLGVSVLLSETQETAIECLRDQDVNIIILNLMLAEGSAFAVADFASYRQPEAKVIFVTNTTFFSDGSIFQHIPNACAFLESGTPPEDLAAMVEHFGTSA